MKTTLIYLMTIVMSLNVAHAQQNNYETAMQKAFELWGQDKPFEAANMFERIAKAENENWLPHYYVAHINIVYSFGERDKEKLSLQLEKAKQQLEKAKQISPDNPEIMVLEALHNTAWIAYDGATYGMTLSAPTSQIYKKASEISPDNPRIVYCKAEWEMGSAKYFGEDTSPFCKDFEKALTLFDTFKNDTPFYPSWGKDRAEILLAECNKTE